MARKQPIRRERIGRPLKEHDPAITPLASCFDEYIEAKRRSISEATEKAYRYPFGLYCRWLQGTGRPQTVSSFTAIDLEAYADYLRARAALPGKRGFDREALSAFSQDGYLRPLRQLGDYLAWAGWIEVNPFDETYDSILPDIKQSTRVLRSTTPEEVRSLLRATGGEDPLDLRDRAILLTAWETGMRTQDLVRLDLGDIDLRTGLVSVRTSKGDRDREVKLGAIALPAVAAYLGTGRTRQLRESPKRRFTDPRALFLSDAAGTSRNRSGRLTSNGVYQAFSRRSAAAGGRLSFGAHRFRHGLATMLVEANVSLALVGRWLGQSLVTTTALYAHPQATAIHRHIAPIIASSLIDPADPATAVA